MEQINKTIKGPSYTHTHTHTYNVLFRGNYISFSFYFHVFVCIKYTALNM